MSNKLAEIAQELTKAKSILIIAHTQPDGDTLGSCFALQKALLLFSKKADICCDSPMPEKYELLFERDQLKKPEEINAEYDIVAALDCADISRLGKAVKIFRKHPITINIDHHFTNDNYASINYVTEASSVGEIIYNLLKELETEPEGKTAEYLYIAISTDTGNFTYSNTNKECLRIASELIGHFSLQETADILFRRRSLSTTVLLTRALATLEMHSNGKIAAMTLLISDISETAADSADSENIVNYAREIDTVMAAALFKELHTGIKVSLRSKGDVDVCAVAAKFGGGGHKNASGCIIGESVDEAKRKIFAALTEIV